MVLDILDYPKKPTNKPCTLVHGKTRGFFDFKMEGKVIQFRRGRHIIHEKHFLIDAGMKNREEAGKLIGKTVEWTSPAGKKIKGKIASPHGTKGLIRAIFEKGLPGQALTTKVKIEE